MFASVDFTLLGMTLIVVAWAIQFLYSWVRGSRLSRTFVIFYGFGLLGLIIEQVSVGGTITTSGWLNITNLLLVVLVLLRLQR